MTLEHATVVGRRRQEQGSSRFEETQTIEFVATTATNEWLGSFDCGANSCWSALQANELAASLQRCGGRVLCLAANEILRFAIYFVFANRK